MTVVDTLLLQREAEWRRCARDETYFFESYWCIRVPGRGKVLFELRDAQRETLRVWSEERYTVALKARQIGFSTLAAAHATWLVLFHSDTAIVMLSKTEREAMKLLKKASYGYKSLPDWMRARGPKVVQSNLTTLSFDNDSSIESMPSASDPARGEAVDLVIVDEWAFLPNAEDAWASIEPITDVGGRVIGISTANGSGNFFHKFYTAAKQGKSMSGDGASLFKAIFYPWNAHADRDDAWYASKAGSMQEWQLHQEYPRDDVECFVKSGNPVYDTDLLDKMQTLVPSRGHVARRAEHLPFEFTETPEGPLRVWAFPREGKRYVMGADVAEGLEHGDFSSLHVVQFDSGEVVAKWHGHIDPDLFGRDVIPAVGHWFNDALAGVEVNNSGLTTCIALRDTGYPWIYYRVSYDERTNKESRKIGWRTQQNTKPMLVDELGAALRDGTLKLWDDETIQELRTFVREPSGRTHGSPYDDQTISLGIANQMLKHGWQHSPVVDRPYKYTFDEAARAVGVSVDETWRIGASAVRSR